ncbi:MAG: hypothetical protein RLZZ86_2350, partial [Cyanobacteriota bacterium]
QKDKLLMIVNDRRMSVPKSVIKFIEKNLMSVQKGKGPNDNNMFDKYINELDDLLEEHNKKEIFKKIDDLLGDLHSTHILDLKMDELNKELARGKLDHAQKQILLKQRNLLQQKINSIKSSYPRGEITNLPLTQSPEKLHAKQMSNIFKSNYESPTSEPNTPMSNIFKSKYQARHSPSPLRVSPKKSTSIFSVDNTDDESYFSDDQNTSYTLREISEELPDVFKSNFTRARLEGKHKLEENIVTRAVSNYRATNSNELTIFEGNLIEIDTMYGNGKVLGKIIDTHNIVNVTDMYRYGTFPITVFLQSLNKNE